MLRKSLFAMGLLSLALAGGCAVGGNGTGPPLPTVDLEISSPSNVNPNSVYPTQSVTITATVANSTSSAVAWAITGPGTLVPVKPATTPATATYTAAGIPGTATVRATLAGTSITGSLPINVVDITTNVSPANVFVGANLVQQFTATAIPDDAPQSFAWTCRASGVPCLNFVSDTSGVATYTAADPCTGNCVQISAASTLDLPGCAASPQNCTIGKATLAASRVNGTYGFRFQGYDGSHLPVAVAGTFTAANGVISTGVEDKLSISSASYSITGGSYTPNSADPNNSNNAGTLTLTLPSGVYPNTFQVVLDAAGDLEMIEADSHGTGSGLAQKFTSTTAFSGSQTYAFGLTGVDAVGSRVGYVGILPISGTGTISGGQIDVNYNGNSSNSVCAAPPCSFTGTYFADPTIGNLWHMTLSLSGTAPLQFDFFLASGQASKTNPLTFVVISNPADSTHPAVSGTMVLQDSTVTYNNAAFNGNSVSALTGTNGVNTNTSLTLGTTDGNGNFSGQFDQNNAGTILSSMQFPPAGGSYTYAASGTNGRYTFQMLGNPAATPVVAPLTFVLYASGANRGFLLDQSSSAVLSGTMSPQGKGSGFLAPSEMPGTYAAATTSSGSVNVAPLAANLLLTYPGGGVSNVSLTTHPAGTPQTLLGSYSILGIGAGTLSLTAPPAQNFVIYAVDTNGCSGQGTTCSIQDFLMMDVDNTSLNPSIIFAKQ